VIGKRQVLVPAAADIGNAAARVRLIVWCKDCSHQVEPGPAEMAARQISSEYGSECLAKYDYI
jgi:hypothetical protein